jgi:hypothetical protein
VEFTLQAKVHGRSGHLEICSKLYLLSKWLFKLLNEECLWLEVLKNKYLKDKCLEQVVIKEAE